MLLLYGTGGRQNWVEPACQGEKLSINPIFVNLGVFSVNLFCIALNWHLYPYIFIEGGKMIFYLADSLWQIHKQSLKSAELDIVFNVTKNMYEYVASF